MSIGSASSSPLRPDFGDVRLTTAEAKAADAALTAASRDGKVTTSELKACEKRLVARYGEAKGQAMLIRALGQDPAKIDFKAVDYLQGRVGAMEGHVANYQAVLVEHLKGAKILDANFDGKLDKNDLVFTKDARGQVNVERIGQALCDKVRIGAAMIGAARGLAESKPDFDDLRVNSQLWTITEPGAMGVAKLKRGAKPSDAINDIFENGHAYAFECATALVLVRYKAMLDLLGPKDFDRICKDLVIGPWVQEDHAAKHWKVRGDGQDGKVAAKPGVEGGDLKPGDYSYFKNWSVSLRGYQEGWQGENVIYLGHEDGKAMYYGHPFGVVSGEDIVSHLNEHRQGRTPKAASLLDLRASLDTRILREDRVEG